MIFIRKIALEAIMTRYFLFLFLFFCSVLSTWGQIYPVEISTVIQPPYPLSLLGYADSSQNKIHVSIIMPGGNKDTYDIRLKLVIKGPDNSIIETDPNSEPGKKIYTLKKGVPLYLESAEIAGMFKPGNIVPYNTNKLTEGFYTFHFEAFDSKQNVRVSNPYVGMQSAWIALLDPPYLISPNAGSIIEPKNSTSSAIADQIRLIWAPRVQPSQDASIIYKLFVYEILPEISKSSDSLKMLNWLTDTHYSKMAIFETRGTQMLLNDGFHSFLLTPGNWYAYQVQIVDEEKITQYKNDGFSAIGTFYYGEGCGNVPALNVLSSGNRKVNVFFTQNPNMDYELQYREKDKFFASWQSVMHVEQGQEIEGLLPEKEYEFRLRGFCNVGYTDFSENISVSSKSTNLKSACIPPMDITVDRKKTNSGDKLQISWNEVPEGRSYSVTLKSEDIFYQKETYALSADFTDIKGLEYNNLELTIGMKCYDNGMYMYADPIPIDLSDGKFKTSTCIAPANMLITAEFDENSNITVLNWFHDIRYKGYRLMYRKLESSAPYKEVSTQQPPVSLRGCEPNVAYECIMHYVCKNGGKAKGVPSTFIVEPKQSELEIKGGCYPPENSNGYISKGRLHVMWQPEYDAQGYQIRWKNKNQDTWLSKETGLSEIYIDKLDDNTLYEYQVRSLCVDSYNFSKWSDMRVINSGHEYNEPEKCPAPVNNRVTVAGNTEAYVTMEQNQLYTHQSLEYRMWGENQWIKPSKVIGNKVFLSNLKNNTLYEYRVQAYCGSTRSAYSAFDTIRTLSEFQIIEKNNDRCGANTNFWINENARPVTNIFVGQMIKAMGWDLTITSVTGSGVFNGEAIAPIPFFANATGFFDLRNIEVNDSREVIGGTIVLKKIAHRNASQNVADILAHNSSILIKGFQSPQDALVLAQYVLGAVAYNTIKPKQADISLYASLDFRKLQEKGYALIQKAIYDIAVSSDSEKMFAEAVYNLKEGMMLLEKALRDDTDNLLVFSSSLPLSHAVVFRMSDNCTCGFDAYSAQEKRDDQYIPVFMPDKNNVYYQPWKSGALHSGGTISARFPLSGSYSFYADGVLLDDSSIRPLGIKENGRNVEISYPAGTLEITAFRHDQSDGNLGSLFAGKVRICYYTPKEQTLVLIPVNDAQLPFKASDIVNELNSIYGQASAYWSINVAQRLAVKGLKKNDFATNDALGAYAPNMEKIIEAYAVNNPLSKNCYYIFYVENDADSNSYMPAGKNIGFLYAKKIINDDYFSFVRTLAQTLGHGVYSLSNMPAISDDSQAYRTDNLMDNFGTSLNKAQWDQISRK